MERGKAGADTAAVGVCLGRGERERAGRWKPEASSTDAARAGGPARSSGEAPVMGVERRGRLIGVVVRASNRAAWLSGRRRVGKTGPTDKSFVISKHLVWEAYRQVRRNKGASGVDEQSLAEFETDLKNNLYKIW